MLWYGLSGWTALQECGADLLEEDNLGRVQAEVGTLLEEVLRGRVCCRAGHDVPPDGLPANAHVPSISHQIKMPPSVMLAMSQIMRLQPCTLPVLCWGAVIDSERIHLLYSIVFFSPLLTAYAFCQV